jgi:hypothetical protein
MRPPDSGSDDLLSREPRERAWARVSPFVFIVSLLFFGLFLYGLLRDMEMPRLMDNVFMLIHAGGHALFRVFGLTTAVAGGTFLQLFVPFALGTALSALSTERRCFYLCASPAAGTQSPDGHTSSGKLSKQLRHSRRRFTVTRHDYRPFQVLSKLF